MDLSRYNTKSELETLLARVTNKRLILKQLLIQLSQDNIEDFINSGVIGIILQCNEVILYCEDKINELNTPKEELTNE